MRGSLRFRRALGVVLAIGLSAAPAALAGGGPELQFQFATSNGHKLTVGGYGATAVITVSKPSRSHGRRAWSSYVVRGQVSPTAIHAAFGALGRVDMRFR